MDFEKKLESDFLIYDSNSSKNIFGCLKLFDLFAIIGFLIFILSGFLDLTPLSEKAWLASPAGIPTFAASLVGCFLLYKKSYLGGFFISLYVGFFIVLETLITYDKVAIQAGQEAQADGMYRSFLDIAADVTSSFNSALLGTVGISIAVVCIIIGWTLHISNRNNFFAEKGLELADEETNDENNAYQKNY